MQNFSQIMYPALAVALPEVLPRDQSVLQKSLTWVWSLADWTFVVQYSTPTTETLHYLAIYLESFHSTKNSLTSYRMSKDTQSIANVRMKDLKVQLKDKHAIDVQKELQAEILFPAQTSKTEMQSTKSLMEVYNSTVHERTCCKHVNILPLLHYVQSVQSDGHLVKDRTEMQEIPHPMMSMWHIRL